MDNEGLNMADEKTEGGGLRGEAWPHAVLLGSNRVGDEAFRECWACAEEVGEELSQLSFGKVYWSNFKIENLRSALSPEALGASERSGLARVWSLIADPEGERMVEFRARLEGWAARGLALGPARVAVAGVERQCIFEKGVALALEALIERRGLDLGAPMGAEAMNDSKGAGESTGAMSHRRVLAAREGAHAARAKRI